MSADTHGAPTRMAKTVRVPFFVRALDRTMAELLGLGIPMGPLTLLTVRGRSTGRPRSSAVALLQRDGRLWLVAAFGEVNWTRNLRAAGQATLTRGRIRQAMVALELTPEAAGRVLKDAVGPASPSRLIAVFLRRYLDVRPDAGFDDFISAARRHPVFELSSFSRGEPPAVDRDRPSPSS